MNIKHLEYLHHRANDFLNNNGQQMLMFENMLKKELDKTSEKIYLDWVNNFLTVAKFAEHYSMSESLANFIIEHWRNKNAENEN